MAGDFDIGPADWAEDNVSNGKGDSPRPLSVDQETFGQRWAETFRACRTMDVLPCDTLGPGGSCLACGRSLETLGDPEE
jgi:hypothetical protein